MGEQNRDAGKDHGQGLALILNAMGTNERLSTEGTLWSHMHFKVVMVPVVWREEQREKEIKMPHTSHFLLSSLYLGQSYIVFPLRIKAVRRDGEELRDSSYIMMIEITGLIKRLYM